ncbi:hypothetical protein AHAS_Ahas03G0248700 [Arachis hypogaea]
MVKQNFIGYHPPSPISNGGWEYHQESTNSEHSNPWRNASEPQDEQDNHMGYFSPPQNDSSHYSNGGWEYHQELKEYEHFPEPQSDSYCEGTYTNDGWEGKCNDPHSNYSRTLSLDRATRAYLDNSSSLDYASTQNPSQDSQPPQTSTSQRFSKLESMFNRIRIELLSKKNEDQLMDVKEKVEEQDEEATASSELSMKNEVVENETALEVTKEHENSQLSQTFLKQNGSTIESMIERYEEEMKKCWEDQQTSSMKKLLSQMLSAKEEVEEQESEKDTQEESHSSEAEKCKEEELMEPPIQEDLNEEITPKITQQPCLDIQEVKATNKSTNPVPEPASKLNQAKFKRKLAERKPRKGTIAETSPPLKSFLLTNWKKRKKVKNR